MGTHKEMLDLIKRCYKVKQPAMFWGGTGIGKSDVVECASKQIADELKLELTTDYNKLNESGVFGLIDERISQYDSSDIKGLPNPNRETKRTEWLPPNWFPANVEAKGIAFMDEINLAPPLVQSSCFLGNTMISGKNYKEIKDLKIGDEVVDKEGNLKKVYELKSRDYTGNMYKIKGRNFMLIEATDEHPFLIIEKYRKGNKKHNVKRLVSSIKWVKTKNLKIGQYIGIPVLQPDNNTQVNSFKLKEKGNLFSQLILDEKLAKFLGYYVGDGYYGGSRIGIALNKTEETYKKEVMQLIYDVFGVEATLKEYSDNCVDVGFYNTEIGEALKKICGENTYHKKIPYEILFNPNKKYLKNFLQGYYNADGHIYNEKNKRTFIGMTTVSKKLALQLQQAFTRFGVLISIFTQPEAMSAIRGEVYHCREAYRMQSSQEEVFKILGETKMNKSKRRTRHFFEENGVLWARIDKIEKEKVCNEKVYNCEVEDTHSYLAHNYIVHNCYQLILNRRLGEYTLPEGYLVIAAGNRATDKAHTFPMAKPLCNRFVHFELDEPSVNVWTDWASTHDIDSRIVCFLNFKQTVYQFKPDSKEVAFLTPRSAEIWSNMIKGIKNDDSKLKVYSGTSVGEGLAVEFCAFTELEQKIDIEKILTNVNTAPLPTNIDMKYALISSVIEYFKNKSSSKKVLSNIMKLSLRQELGVEFGSMMLTLIKNSLKTPIIMLEVPEWKDVTKVYNRFLVDS